MGQGIGVTAMARVIELLFVGAFLKEDTSIQVAWLFIAAMLAFFIALVLFLREIMLATATLDIGLRHAATGEHPTPP